MAIYKTSSAGRTIAKIFRDLKPPNDNWVDDGLEWIGESLELIGAAAQTVKKIQVLPITNFTASLPCDLYYINMVNFNPHFDRDNPSLEPLPEDFKVPLRYETSEFPESMHAEGCVNKYAKTAEGYWIEAGALKTTFEKGYVCISYQAFPTDENGWPMVPDSASFRQAIYWYVVMKLMEGGFKHPNPEIGYEIAINQWNKYCTQAENEAKFPDIDRAESFFNQWVRLLPNVNRHEDFFNDLNQREQLERDRHITTQIPTSGIFDRNKARRI